MVPTTTMQIVLMEKPRRYQQKPNRLHYDQSKIDINSDHNPVTIKFKVKLKKIKRNQAQSQIDYNLLKDDTYKGDILVKNYYVVLGSEKVEQDHESEEGHVEKEWSKVKLSLQNAAKELLPKK